MIELTEKKLQIEPVSSANGIEIYSLPEPGTYRWYDCMTDIFATWSPLGWRDHSVRQWWFPNFCESAYQFGAPLLSAVGAEGNNRVTLSLSDSVCRGKLTVSVDDLNQKDEIILTATLSDGIRQQKNGEVFLRVDRRDIDYNEAVRQAGEWMRSFLPGGQIPVPENAALPLYSSWYNFHQEPEQSLLEAELELAAKTGFRTFILDDGWQFEGGNAGDYRRCGDWHVAKDKFPDFKGFCDKVHSLGIKMLLWFPVPFVGFETEDYKRLKDKIAFERKEFGAGVLDVRYPDIREYIVGIYKRFVSDYGIDGLKLDFIDAFKADPAGIAPFAEGMDIENLDEAVRVLMDGIYNEMTAVNPDFMFEFRQNYIGAEIVNHCNMLRVADCAADSITNRIGTAALRLVNGGTAIHSDMLLWAKTETPLNCARQLLNIMFAVPQISVLLTKIPDEQYRVIKRFVSYWTENRDVILNGKFRAEHPEANYTSMSAEAYGKKITVLYYGNSFKPCGLTEDIFNGTECGRLVSEGGFAFEYRIYDYYGDCIEEGRSGGSPELFPVPRGGMISIIPMK